jgi:hypothetical protein
LHSSTSTSKHAENGGKGGIGNILEEDVTSGLPTNNCFNLGAFENRIGAPLEKKEEDSAAEARRCEDHIILNHIGHIGTVSDFDWNHLAPWTIISASDDAEPFNQLQRNNESSL